MAHSVQENPGNMPHFSDTGLSAGTGDGTTETGLDSGARDYIVNYSDGGPARSVTLGELYGLGATQAFDVRFGDEATANASNRGLYLDEIASKFVGHAQDQLHLTPARGKK